ncbi:ribonuclease III domain-containing protein [Cryomyces antarcticus]
MARLNEKYPETAPYARVPSHYDSSKDLNLNEPLPPLPPISDPHYAQAPFNHSSTAHLDRSSAVNDLSYERLEFLGDAYVEIMATRIIFSRYPHLPAGRQAQLRELVVKNVTLAQLAQGYDFGKRVRISNQEIESAGENAWTKILADVFEAYVAALVLSSPADGFETVEAWLKMEMDKSTSTQNYFLGVYLTGWGHVKQHLGSGTGQNKVQAGANAAADAMERNKDLIEACSKMKAEFDLQRKAERPSTVDEPTEQASVKR